MRSRFDGYKPHVLKDFHYQFSNTLFIVYPSNHSNTDIGNPFVPRKLQTNIFENLDYTFSYTYTSVLNKGKQYKFTKPNTLYCRPVCERVAGKKPCPPPLTPKSHYVDNDKLLYNREISKKSPLIGNQNL